MRPKQIEVKLREIGPPKHGHTQVLVRNAEGDYQYVGLYCNEHVTPANLIGWFLPLPMFYDCHADVCEQIVDIMHWQGYIKPHPPITDDTREEIDAEQGYDGMAEELPAGPQNDLL